MEDSFDDTIKEVGLQLLFGLSHCESYKIKKKYVASACGIMVHKHSAKQLH